MFSLTDLKTKLVSAIWVFFEFPLHEIWPSNLSLKELLGCFDHFLQIKNISGSKQLVPWFTNQASFEWKQSAVQIYPSASRVCSCFTSRIYIHKVKATTLSQAVVKEGQIEKGVLRSSAQIDVGLMRLPGIHSSWSWGWSKRCEWHSFRWWFWSS